MLSVLANLSGLLIDETKDVDNALAMVVLGMMVELSLAHAKVLVCLELEKANNWMVMIQEALREMILLPFAATKLAGRLQWAICGGRSKAGRSYLKALFAQANKPMPGFAVSIRLRQALEYFLELLSVRPPSVWRTLVEDRCHLRTWTDASGVDGIICAVVFFEKDWFYTVAVVPQKVRETLLPRGDNQIGLLELLGPILVLGTWFEWVSSSVWSSWIDNQGSLHNLLKGSSLSPEMNFLVGQFWLSLTAVQSSLFVERVESSSNVADGPTRHDVSHMERLGAKRVEPQWPHFIYRIWDAKLVK